MFVLLDREISEQSNGLSNYIHKVSKPIFRPSKPESINSIIYKKRFLPFIRDHPDSNYIFWSNLAVCNYSKSAVSWMEENVKICP